MHCLKALKLSCGERGSNTWPSDLQSDALPTELSPQRCNNGLDIKIVYISFFARLNLKEVEVNSEYQAPRKYRFMEFFLFARDHKELLQTVRGVGMLISLLFINPISNTLHMNDLIFSQINDLSRCLNELANKFMFFPIYTYFLLEYNS